MMKRMMILIFIVINCYAMGQADTVTASPRTDEAAIKHKLSLLIHNADINILLTSMSSIKERLKSAEETTYKGKNNLQVTFKLAGLSAHVYKVDLIGKQDTRATSYTCSIDELQRLLQIIKNAQTID